MLLILFVWAQADIFELAGQFANRGDHLDPPVTTKVTAPNKQEMIVVETYISKTGASTTTERRRVPLKSIVAVDLMEKPGVAHTRRWFLVIKYRPNAGSIYNWDTQGAEGAGPISGFLLGVYTQDKAKTLRNALIAVIGKSGKN